jgi:methionyl-tRNA synthetase
MRADIDKQAINSAFEHVVRLSSKANEYVDQQAPWALYKTDPMRMEAVLYTLVEVIRCIAIMLQPIVPGSAEKMLSLLNLNECNFSQLNADYALKPGTPLPSSEIIFSRLG